MRPLKLASRAALAAAIVIVSIALGASASHALEIKRMTLSNGAVLLVSEQHQLPMVTIAIAFDAGSRRDPAGKAGLAALTAHCLTLGTRTIPAAEFNRTVDFMGSSIGVDAGRDYATASMTSLKKYQGQTLKLLAGILEQPGLRDADIIRKRNQQVASLKAAQQQPGYVASLTFNKMLFDDTPYGHLSSGTVESVSKLTPADVRNFYRTYYKMGSAVIAVVGDVNADQIKATLEQELAGPVGTVQPQAAPPPPKVTPGVHLKVIDRNVAQANLVLGFGGVARSNPDFYRIRVMNYVLGSGGFASRLMKVVRTKNGLAYSIGSAFDSGKFIGGFQVVLQTKNSSTNEALKLVLQQIREMREKPISPAELEAAKKFLVGSFPLLYDRQSSIASFLLQIEIYHLGLDYADKYPGYIDSVTIPEVQRVAQKYLDSGAIDVVAVANQSQAKVSVVKFAGTAK